MCLQKKSARHPEQGSNIFQSNFLPHALFEIACDSRQKDFYSSRFPSFCSFQVEWVFTFSSGSFFPSLFSFFCSGIWNWNSSSNQSFCFVKKISLPEIMTHALFRLLIISKIFLFVRLIRLVLFAVQITMNSINKVVAILAFMKSLWKYSHPSGYY